ncbi:MAG TPA: hypothetical protein VKK79_11465, partial [Candidatus Lokiarchaeia archaeon]|nr:hypothetical protein [Candidatus Lokiarchaeia archaeon]
QQNMNPWYTKSSYPNPTADAVSSGGVAYDGPGWTWQNFALSVGTSAGVNIGGLIQTSFGTHKTLSIGAGTFTYPNGTQVACTGTGGAITPTAGVYVAVDHTGTLQYVNFGDIPGLFYICYWTGSGVDDLRGFTNPTSGTGYGSEIGRDPAYAMFASKQVEHPVSFDSNGKMIGSTRQDGSYQAGSTGNWLLLNIRLFESAGTYAFLNTLVTTLASNLRLAAGVQCANASLFGYEVYNIGGLELPMGGRDPAMQAYCNSITGGSSGGGWNIPNSTGSVVPPAPTSPLWPPKLPGYTPVSYETSTMNIRVESVISPDIVADIEGWLGVSLSSLNSLLSYMMSHLGDLINLLMTGTFPLTLQTLSVNNPIPLPMWIMDIRLTVNLNLTATQRAIVQTNPKMLWVEFLTYPGQPTYTGSNQPWLDFNPNPLTELGVYTPWGIQGFTLYLQLPSGVISLLMSLIGGGSLSLQASISEAYIDLAIPAAWDWHFTLALSSLMGGLGLGSLGL